jgi:hypothetical protein
MIGPPGNGNGARQDAEAKNKGHHNLDRMVTRSIGSGKSVATR